MTHAGETFQDDQGRGVQVCSGAGPGEDIPRLWGAACTGQP